MTGDHLGLSVSVTKKSVSKGVLPKGAISPDSIKTRHKTKPANFYLYKCSHCLCSQACTCSCKNKVCLCNSHLCGNYVFPFRIRRGLNKKKKECKLSLIMTFISKFYLYKCAHCLGCCGIPPPPGGTDVFYPRLQAFLKEPLVRISKKTLFIVQVGNR